MVIKLFSEEAVSNFMCHGLVGTRGNLNMQFRQSCNDASFFSFIKRRHDKEEVHLL